MKKLTKSICLISSVCAVALCAFPLSACADERNETVTLRVSNWEEYIDLGDWDEDDTIEIDNPYDEEAEGICGRNSIVDDFTEWFNSQDFGFNVNVEYSTFGTNEDLYNMLNLGDVYDVVCPSDYLIMQLLHEGKLEPYSQDFRSAVTEDADGSETRFNYYSDNVSPFIKEQFASIDEDYDLNDYAAGYMWGTSGFIFNPQNLTDSDKMDERVVRSWQMLENSDYYRKVTIKDNVRDAYFAALGIYAEKQSAVGNEIDLQTFMNNPDRKTIDAAEEILKSIKNNVYSFETDSGKSDMITGKVTVNFQWSGDGAYIMSEAEKDEENPVKLWYAVPDIAANLWFDGWVMLKDGIDGNAKKKTAAEAFVNFLSRPDNAVRNMEYIGYTSAIADEVTLDYLNYRFSADEDDEVIEYDLSYFFGENTIVYASAEDFKIDEEGSIWGGRQLFAQYPTQQVTDRSIVMRDFSSSELKAINQMWINVRCLDVKDFNPAVVWPIVSILAAGAVAIVIIKFRHKIFRRKND